MKAEVYSVTYRIPLTNAQQARLERKWPDGDPFISYEKISSIDVPSLIADSNTVRVALEKLGKDHMESLGSSLIPQIKTVSAAQFSSTPEE